MSPLELLRSRLEDHGCKPRGNGDTIEFCCPLHNDRRASAGATLRDGQVLILCHVCGKERTGEILEKLGLTWSDLYADDDRKAKREIRAIYDYVDEDGTLLYQVVRYKPKDFKQRRPDGRGDWIWNLRGTRRVLYRLPAVIDAVAAGRRVWIAEGEKDVHCLDKLGEVATTNPMGAGKWSHDYAKALRGADVAMIADNDEKGLAHARVIVKSLTGIANNVALFGVPDGRKDVSEHLAAGGKLDELEPVGTPKSEPGRLSDMLLDDIGGMVSDEALEGVDSVKDLMRLLDGEKKSVARKIVDAVCLSDVVLFHDDADRGFAWLKREGHRETHAIRSRAFKHYAPPVFRADRGSGAEQQRSRGRDRCARGPGHLPRPAATRIYAHRRAGWLDLSRPLRPRVEVRTGRARRVATS